MNLKDALIVWTPKTGPFAETATAGKIAVTTIPEPAALKEHPMSTGACDHDWQETDHAGRVALLKEHFTQIVQEHGLDADEVRKALSVIDDFHASSLT